jgi:hypothetical protein
MSGLALPVPLAAVITLAALLLTLGRLLVLEHRQDAPLPRSFDAVVVVAVLAFLVLAAASFGTATS